MDARKIENAKRGPALFEVLTKEAVKGTDALKVPAPRPETEHHAPQGAIRLSPRPTKPQPDEGTRSRYGSGDVRIPFVKLDEGRIRMTFTSMTAAVAVFTALAMVVAAFELGGHLGFRDGVRIGHEAGRNSYAAETLSDIEAARREPPATYLVSNLMDSPPENGGSLKETSAREAGSGGQPQWIRDYTYIVAQEFAADRLDNVEPAREFLAKHGILTTTVRLANGAVQSITTQGYNHKDPTQKRVAERLLEKEHQVGAKYYAAAGGYRLKGYFKTLKGDGW